MKSIAGSTKRFIFFFVQFFVLTSLVGGAWALDLDQTVDFNIPKQKLDSALVQFSEQAKMQITSSSDQVKDFNTDGIVGRYKVSVALKTLLQRSGLSYRPIGQSAISIGKFSADSGQSTTQNASPGSSDDVSSSKEGKKNSSQDFRVAQVDQTSAGPQAVGSDQNSENKKKEEGLTEIVVTGTHIRGLTDSPSPVRKITRAEIDATGVTTTEDLMATLPENVGGIGVGTSMASIPAQGGQQNFDFASGVNLRGLGSDATLVLLNGHRLPLASNGFSVDISTIPLAVIDHVDILKDGASSIYGSDAVAGVVNFVTVSRFEGARSDLTLGTVTDGGKRDLNLNQTLGTSWNSGSIFGAYSFNSQGALSTADRPNTASSVQPSDAIPPMVSNALYLSLNQQAGKDLDAQLDVLASERRFYTVSSLEQTDPNTGNPAVDSINTHIRNRSLVTNGSLWWSLSSQWRISLSGQFAASESALVANDTLNLFPNNIKTKGRQSGADLAADGPVFTLPGGAVRVAVGIADRNESYKSGNAWDLSRNVRAGYGEFFVPVIGTTNAMPGIQRLELTISDRYDRYSDFGGTNNPKYGVLFAPITDLAFRGSYSTSFRAPLLSELARDPNSTEDLLLPFADAESPTGKSNQIIRVGGNSDLKAETSRSVTAGLDFHPESIKGLVVAVDYFDIDFKGRIASPGTPRLASNPALYGPFITRNPSAALVQSIANGPLFKSLINPWTPSDVALIADDRLQNLSSVKVEGIDFNSKWTQPLPSSTLVYGLDASYLLKYEQTLTPGQSPINSLNTPYFPTKLRLRASVGWTVSNWSSTLFGNYVSAYTNNLDPANITHVGSWTTVDGQISYRLPKFSIALQETRVSLSVQNIFDRQPPFVLNAFAGSSASSANFNYDPVNASLLGRYLSLRLTTRW